MKLFVDIIVVIIYIAVRYYYWSKTSKNSGITADGYLSMLFVKEFQRNGRKRIKYYPYEIIKQPLIYPTLGAKILSFVNLNNIIKYVGLMNSFIDLLFFGLILGTLNYLNISYINTIIVSFTFILLPTIFGLNFSSPMHFSLTWRDLGRLITTMYFISIAVIYFNNNILLMTIPILLYILVFYSSLFGLQAVVFGTIIMSILSLNYIPIFLVIISNLLLFAFDRKYYYQYHKSRYGFFKNYYINIRHSHPGTTGDSAFSFQHIAKAIGYIFKFRYKELKRTLFSDPLLRGILLLIIQIPVAIGLLLVNTEVSHILLYLYLTSVILWLLTLNSVLKIFGEPDRYLEFFGYFPILVGLGYVLNYCKEDVIIYLVYFTMFFQIGIAIFQIFISIKAKSKVGIDDKLSLYPYLKDENIFPISMSESRKISYVFDCNTLRASTMLDPKEFSFITTYPMPNWINLGEVCEKYKIRYLVITNKYNHLCKFDIIDKYFNRIDADKNYTIYQIRDKIVG